MGTVSAHRSRVALSATMIVAVTSIMPRTSNVRSCQPEL